MDGTSWMCSGIGSGGCSLLSGAGIGTGCILPTGLDGSTLRNHDVQWEGTHISRAKSVRIRSCEARIACIRSCEARRGCMCSCEARWLGEVAIRICDWEELLFTISQLRLCISYFLEWGTHQQLVGL